MGPLPPPRLLPTLLRLLALPRLPSSPFWSGTCVPSCWVQELEDPGRVDSSCCPPVCTGSLVSPWCEDVSADTFPATWLGAVEPAGLLLVNLLELPFFVIETGVTTGSITLLAGLGLGSAAPVVRVMFDACTLA